MLGMEEISLVLSIIAISISLVTFIRTENRLNKKIEISVLSKNFSIYNSKMINTSGVISTITKYYGSSYLNRKGIDLSFKIQIINPSTKTKIIKNPRVEFSNKNKIIQSYEMACIETNTSFSSENFLAGTVSEFTLFRSFGKNEEFSDSKKISFMYEDNENKTRCVQLFKYNDIDEINSVELEDEYKS